MVLDIKNERYEDLSSGSETAMEIILIHPMMQITDPDGLILSTGSLMCVRRVLLLVLMIRNVRRRRRRCIMLRRQHMMLHYHSRRGVLHRHPLLWQWKWLRRRWRLLLPLLVLLLRWLRIGAVCWLHLFVKLLRVFFLLEMNKDSEKKIKIKETNSLCVRKSE